MSRAGEDLVAALGEIGAGYDRTGPAAPAPVTVLSGSADALLVRVGSVVVKAHAVGTDPKALTDRIAIAAMPETAGILLAPLRPEPVRALGRLVSLWPCGTPVPSDPAAVPWADAGRLLAGLHRVPPPAVARLPPAGAPARLAGALAGLASCGDDKRVSVVRAAWRALPRWVRDGEPGPGPRTVIHGDWHLGQLVAVADGWRLTDVDDLGTGQLVWDFGRLAAFRALGMVREEEFRGFLDAYWSAGGPGLRPAAGRPELAAQWVALDAVAGASLVTSAARRLARAGSDADPLLGDLLRACGRLARNPTG